MTDEQDRRAQGAGRVPVQTLVEICGRDVGGAPAFEAEAMDVSGRGMHVRTAYLPEIGAPLVCRFEDHGREIVVEGVVAWRTEQARGGEFGMKFTALDSGSVDALRELCGLGEPLEPEPPAAAEAAETPSRMAQGSRVRLHIDGLGSPMKASVRDGGSRKLEVASNLEFLKVGRHLEIEDLNAGMRRNAHIDAVNVIIDPSSQVPQLVVSLRYDDVDEQTPEPSVIDNMPVTEASRPEAMLVGAPTPRYHASAASDDEHDEIASAEIAPEDEIVHEADALRGRLGAAAVSAGAAAKTGGAKLAQFGAVAAVGMGKLFKGASEKVLELRRRRASEQAPKRVTAPPPTGVLSADGRRLRPQSSAKTEEAAAPAKQSRLSALSQKPRAKKLAALGALAVLVMTVSVLALKKPAQPPPGANAEAGAVSVAVAASGDAIEVDDQGNPIEKPGADSAKKLSDKTNDKGVSADVPLFGPTTMATMEPAPLGAAPEAAEGEQKEPADDKAKNEVADELWPDDKSGDSGGDDSKKANPSDVAPWGHGKLVSPTVHRLRLDGPGGAIQGAINPTGFSVVIPDRKVMESGKPIEQRDSRIARVKTRNGSSGAQIAFQFKNGVPGYRVRLRKDYVEILISAEGSNSSTAPKKSISSGGGKAAPKKQKKAKKDDSAKALSTSNKKSEKKAKKKHADKTDG
jgi:hypothetical protein